MMEAHSAHVHPAMHQCQGLWPSVAYAIALLQHGVLVEQHLAKLRASTEHPNSGVCMAPGDLPQGFVGGKQPQVHRAAIILRLILEGGAAAQAAALSLAVDPPLMTRCCTALTSAASPSMQAGAKLSLPTHPAYLSVRPHLQVCSQTAACITGAIINQSCVGASLELEWLRSDTVGLKWQFRSMACHSFTAHCFFEHSMRCNHRVTRQCIP